MPAKAWPAAGTTIAVDETGTGTYTQITQVTSVKGVGGGDVAQAKTTWLSSAAHTYRGTIKDPGEIEIDLNFDPTDAVHIFLRDAVDAASTGPFNFKTVFPTGVTTSTAVTSGNVSGMKGIDAGDVEENLQSSITIKQTGLPTWVAV